MRMKNFEWIFVPPAEWKTIEIEWSIGPPTIEHLSFFCLSTRNHKRLIHICELEGIDLTFQKTQSTFRKATLLSSLILGTIADDENPTVKYNCRQISIRITNRHQGMNAIYLFIYLFIWNIIIQSWGRMEMAITPDWLRVTRYHQSHLNGRVDKCGLYLQWISSGQKAHRNHKYCGYRLIKVDGNNYCIHIFVEICNELIIFLKQNSYFDEFTTHQRC